LAVVIGLRHHAGNVAHGDVNVNFHESRLVPNDGLHGHDGEVAPNGPRLLAAATGRSNTLGVRGLLGGTVLSGNCPANYGP